MSTNKVQLGLTDTLAILLPYLKDKLLEQVKSIWFIVFYLLFFQIAVLGLPIVYSTMIAVGMLVVVIGLMFFMEGLRIGLMPLGEMLGAVLPRNSTLPLILLFSFLLGLGATFAEPAIAVLRAAGAGVKPDDAPLLFSLLNDFPQQLVLSVGVGVGLAVMLGVVRFFFGWSLKYLIIPGLSLLLLLTIVGNLNPVIQPVLGLAWDCGAVTTGPVTVPLVLALGVGVCRIVGNGDAKNAGFGIVTLASLFPILAVLLLTFFHFYAGDYYGAENYKGNAVYEAPLKEPQVDAVTHSKVTEREFKKFLRKPILSPDYDVYFKGGEMQLVEGRIQISDSQIVLEKKEIKPSKVVTGQSWNPKVSIVDTLKTAAMDALRAIVPLCLFLFISLN